MSEPGRVRKPHVTSAEAQQFYRRYSTDEDRRRTNVHYEQPVEFFYAITGGTWNVYSGNLWDGASTETASQEAKLDLLAGLMRLRAGQRILDVGCGWGGPLAYLCQRYDVRGVGLTLSPLQRAAALERFARVGVEAVAVERHWRDFDDADGFDAIYTDEVIVHFEDLAGYFAKVRSLLRPGGMMVNKELHFTHPRYAQNLTRIQAYVNELYGATGNYRTLAQELRLVEEADLELRQVHQIPAENYRRTIEQWMANMHARRDRLVELVGADYYRRFRTYLEIARRYIVTGETMTLDVVAARK